MNNAIKPDHYRKGRQYQPWDVAKDWDLDFDLGSVLKYIGRCGRKAGNSKIQDLKKAAEFLKHEIDCLEADEPKDENISVEIPEHKWEWENLCTYGTCLYLAYKTKVYVGNEILVTANLREWRNIFKLRAVGVTGKPHPQMVEVMVPLLEEVKKQIPVVFDDLVTE